MCRNELLRGHPTLPPFVGGGSGAAAERTARARNVLCAGNDAEGDWRRAGRGEARVSQIRGAAVEVLRVQLSCSREEFEGSARTCMTAS